MGKKLDIKNQKFGRLTVMENVGYSKWHATLWKCKCNCGNEIVVIGSNLKNGSTQSCGCLNKERVSKARKLDLRNQRFGKLVVLEEVGRTIGGDVLWKCCCDCGNIKIINGSSLRAGFSKSCGCLARKLTSERSKINLTGQQFGRLLVLKEVGKNKYGNILWECFCDCGNKTTVAAPRLINSNTQSCGCYRMDRLVELGKQRCGELSPVWKGGISKEPYCFEFTKDLKEFIKQRDGYKCMNPCCLGYSKILDVHHMNYNKKSCGLENLITLCRSCNSKANFDREWHIAWYQAIMYRRYGYVY